MSAVGADRRPTRRSPPTGAVAHRPDPDAAASGGRGAPGHVRALRPRPRPSPGSSTRSRRPACAVGAAPGSPPPPSCGPWPPGAVGRWWWPTGPRASRPAPRTRCCWARRRTWCSTGSSWWPTCSARATPSCASTATGPTCAPRWSGPATSARPGPPVRLQVAGRPRPLRGRRGDGVGPLAQRGRGQAHLRPAAARSSAGCAAGPRFTSNVETYAQIGLIARYGADWYRALGHDRRAGHHPAHRDRRRGPTRGVRSARWLVAWRR